MLMRPRAIRIGVVGGGLVGLATALKLLRQMPGSRVSLWEKEPELGRHQSTHNSGVLHAGLYYRPGSLKARLAVAGIREMTEFCCAHNIAHAACGKLVIATQPDEVARLRTLHERGQQNGLRHLRWIEAEEIASFEPHAAGLAALHVPEEGIVDYAAVVRRIAELVLAEGGEIVNSARVVACKHHAGAWRVQTTQGDFASDFLVTCAGLHSDRVAALAGENCKTRIVPFRGEYYELRPERRHLVRNLIYPVPDPVFPFLGVHFTRLIHGGIEAGPNAVLAFAREGYALSRINLPDVADSLAFPGLWRFLFRHRGMCFQELVRSFSRTAFCRALQKLVPAIVPDDLQPGDSGVRAQAMEADGTLVQDFALIERANALHVVNAPSPGATASLAIGGHIANLVARTLAL